MKSLEQAVQEHDAITRPVKQASIDELESLLSFPLSAEYREYLCNFGVIAYGAYETYGLGVPDGYYLNVLNAYNDLHGDFTYPANSLPLLDIGDGRYFLYDNKNQRIVLWSTPNGGVIRVIDDSLKSFLLKHIFE